MKPSTSSLAQTGDVPRETPEGGKIIQRILPGTGSDLSKATSMADADEELVVQVKNGDASAYEALVRKHQIMIHALTYRMTGSVADAEDLAQETFIRAYQQIDSFNGAAKFGTWLYGIAVHACLNWRRDEARRYRAQANCAEESMVHPVTGEAAGNDMAQQVQAALIKLPVKQRADHVRRPESCRSGESIGMFRNDGFLAGVCGETKAEKPARNRGRETMNDQELAAKLRAVQVPARSDDYWENFPQIVCSQLRPAPVASMPRSSFLSRMAWAGGLAYASLMFALLAGPVHTVLKTEKTVRYELAQLPSHLRTFMADEHGLHYLVMEKE
jgi:RNA polymerase sigma-70 factor (ECF subfamily)